LAVVYVKDFVWEKGAVKEVPLGHGQVSRKFFQLLRQTAFNGPICLHEEYFEGKEHEREIKAALTQDLATLRSWLEA
jgi:L-ribulose-5-phosphate 3-epimerase UlaE